jgi:hypothetical protein
MQALPLNVSTPRPHFHDEPAIDRLIAMNLALLREVSVLKDRVTTLEKLGEAAGWLAEGALDAYHPDLAERTVREAVREAMVGRVLNVLGQEIEELERGADAQGYWRTIEGIETGEV